MKRHRNLPKEAAHNMFQKPHGLLLHKLGDHVAQDRPNRVESFIGGADICKANIIE